MNRLLIAGSSLVVTGGASAVSLASAIVLPLLQNLTVTRAVNGVTKAQTSGTTVELYEPAYYAL